MRISDWSSDVCSSDLFGANRDAEEHLAGAAQVALGLETPEAVGGARLAPGRALVGGDPESPGGVDGAVVRRAEPAVRGGRLVIAGANLRLGRVAGDHQQVPGVSQGIVVAVRRRQLDDVAEVVLGARIRTVDGDRKSTRLNSSP